jgi:membrane-associated phospholipid phosphatase
MICLIYSVDFLWAWRAGLTIGGFEIKACWIGAPLTLSAVLRRRDRGIATLAEAFALWFAFAGAVIVLSYLAASCAFPLQDAVMERLDRAIGFDWSAWHNAVIDRPLLDRLLSFAYNSLPLQILISIIYFSPTGKSSRIGEMLLLACATAVPTILISAIWPTLGPSSDFSYVRDLLALRAGGPWHFELAAMQGIVSMPSYHTVLTVLFIYAFRGTGLIGYGIATLNLVMLLSICPIGGHYLVDVFAGGALAVAAIAVHRAVRPSIRREAARKADALKFAVQVPTEL